VGPARTRTPPAASGDTPQHRRPAVAACAAAGLVIFSLR
jgi:hypothetical protein